MCMTIHLISRNKQNVKLFDLLLKIRLIQTFIFTSTALPIRVTPSITRKHSLVTIVEPLLMNYRIFRLDDRQRILDKSWKYLGLELMRKISPSMPCAMTFFFTFFFKGMGAFLC